jgi:hypothetical protein
VFPQRAPVDLARGAARCRSRPSGP